jgi:hypothetical protein
MTISENAACDPDPDPDTDTDTDTNTNQQQDGNVYIFTSSTRSNESKAEDLEAKAKEILAGETEAEKAARKNGARPPRNPTLVAPKSRSTAPTVVPTLTLFVAPSCDVM